MSAVRRYPTRRQIGFASAALVVGALALCGCGRKGTPEVDTGEPVVKADTNSIVPGFNLPQKPASAQPQKKPKGNFILDPLL